jgi:GMP synthase-like glutamine amidotransferase
MNIHFIQNDPIVLPANAEEWARARNHNVKITRAYEGEALPDQKEFDLAIILGGRMGAYEEDKYPWLIDVKEWTEAMIEADKYILGICLGAQIISDTLGGSVRPHDHPEVGWFRINFKEEANDHPLLTGLQPPTQFYEFHFDTFEIPRGAQLLASSRTCARQMFAVGSRVLGVQFHPEFTAKSIQDALNNTSETNAANHYAQDPVAMVDEQSIEISKAWLFQLLDRFWHLASSEKERKVNDKRDF